LTDIFNKEKRSEIMGKIRGKNTAPEVLVRKILFSKGYRYRIHDNRLPGSPDISLPRHKLVIMVHGCFWHGHARCRLFRIPKTRVAFWKEKIGRNRVRDASVKRRLKRQGWRVLTVWECQLKPARIGRTMEKVFMALREK
jgi:DNA mismatch endonuclease (patch repair protein)